MIFDSLDGVGVPCVIDFPRNNGSRLVNRCSLAAVPRWLR
jgi:hypothetical protein